MNHNLQIGLTLVCLGLVILSAVVCFCPSNLAAIFSSDQAFVQRVVEASVPLAALVASMNLTVALEVRTVINYRINCVALTTNI